MEDFRQSRNASPSSRNSSNAPSRTHTPSRLVLTSVVIDTVSSTNSPTAGNGSPVVTTAVMATNQALESPEADNVSKETSFIKEKKKGLVETV